MGRAIGRFEGVWTGREVSGQLRWLRVFDVLGNSFGVGLQARGFDVGVYGRPYRAN